MAAVEDADWCRAILFTVCGNLKYALMKDLVCLDKNKNKTYDELVEITAKTWENRVPVQLL